MLLSAVAPLVTPSLAILPWERILPAAATAVIAVAAMATVWFLLTLAVRRAVLGNESRPPATRARVLRLSRAIRITLEVTAGIVVILIFLRGGGVGLGRLSWRQFLDWWLGPGLRILLIFAGAFILVRIVDFFVDHLLVVMARVNAGGLDWEERRKRISTMGRLLRALAVVIILGTASLMALREVHVDITPILTGAGVLGVAIGFGAQSVVKDVISGAFLILENQIRVGDVVTINNKTGLVESIRLRILVLRALDGTVYIFQNGSVGEIANLTKDYSYAMLTLSLAYKEDPDRVSQVLQAVGRELQADPAFREKILSPLEILGIDSLAGAGIGLKMRIKTAPMQQWAVDREFRRRVKERFDREQIILA